MGRLIFGMMQSLDGYIDHLQLGPPGPILARHFADYVRGLDGLLYGRRMYEIMRYWDEDQPGWDEMDHDFAQVWRPKPKWVASRSLTSVGPNATLVQGDLIDFAASLKSERDGDIDVSGAELANVLSAAGLVDEYRLYFRPYVLGTGKPYFAGPRPPLRLIKLDAIGEDAVRLTYGPA
ncbi:MAG: dihydrofolate reductase family protein [Acidobacteriaceae bacterium]|jgi:dihydrofolate reductase